MDLSGVDLPGVDLSGVVLGERTLFWTDRRDGGRVITVADLALEGVDPRDPAKEESLEDDPRLGGRCGTEDNLSMLAVKEWDLLTAREPDSLGVCSVGDMVVALEELLGGVSLS